MVILSELFYLGKPRLYRGQYTFDGSRKERSFHDTPRPLKVTGRRLH